MSDEHIVRHTLEQVLAMKGQTDWNRVAATTDSEVDSQAVDPDDVLLTDDELAGGYLAPPIPMPSTPPSPTTWVGPRVHVYAPGYRHMVLVRPARPEGAWVRRGGRGSAADVAADLAAVLRRTVPVSDAPSAPTRKRFVWIDRLAQGSAK